MGEQLAVAGGQISYETFGSGGRVVVAIPGIGDTRASYRRLAPMLAEADLTVHVMDLRGHGESSADFPSYTSEDIGQDAVALLDALDVHDATLVGNSVGAAASAHAALGSDRVGRLVALRGFVGHPPTF